MTNTPSNRTGFWNSGISKAVRWILYIPVIQLALTLLNIGLFYLTYQLFEFNWTFWNTLIFLVFLSSTLILIPISISALISVLTISICPDKKTGGYIYAIFAVINFTYILYLIWTIDIKFTWGVTISIIISTIVILLTAGYSIYSALEFSKDE